MRVVMFERARAEGGGMKSLSLLRGIAIRDVSMVVPVGGVRQRQFRCGLCKKLAQA